MAAKEFKISGTNLREHYLGRPLKIALIAALALSACADSKDRDHPEFTEAHFAVTCPPGSQPGIMRADTSGALPRPPEDGKYSNAVVELACSGGEEPQIVQDKVNGGTCLGYGDESHLTIKVTAPPSDRAVEFFVQAETNDIGIIGPELNSELGIEGVSIHQHDLGSPFDQAEFERNNC